MHLTDSLKGHDSPHVTYNEECGRLSIELKVINLFLSVFKLVLKKTMHESLKLFKLKRFLLLLFIF